MKPYYRQKTKPQNYFDDIEEYFDSVSEYLFGHDSFGGVEPDDNFELVFEESEKTSPKVIKLLALWPESVLGFLELECGLVAKTFVYCKLRCSECEKLYHCQVMYYYRCRPEESGFLSCVSALFCILRGFGCKHTTDAETLFALYTLENPAILNEGEEYYR